MKNMLKVEEAMQLILAIFLFNDSPFAWWTYAVWFLAPDVSMLGYIFGPRVGAYCYNLFHHKGVAVLLYLIGAYSNSHVLIFGGLVLFGHSAFDRILGYGLKYTDDFKHTHLGQIGESAPVHNN